MKLGKVTQFVLGCAIAAGGLYVFLRNVDIGRLKAELSTASATGLTMCAVLAVLTLGLRAVRWRVLLPATDGTHKANLFGHVMIGFMVNSILPARAGEAVRALLLWRKNGYSPAVSFGSLIVERLIDVIVFMTFFVLPIYLLPALAEHRPWAHAVTGLIAAMVAGFVFYAAFDRSIGRIARRLTGLLPERFRGAAHRIGMQLGTTLHWLSSPRRVAAVAVLSIMTTACYPLMMVILLDGTKSFGLLEGMFSQAFAALGAAIPLAPGYVGTLHATLQYGLKLLGVDAEPAAALAILYHAINVIPVTIVGMYFFFRTDMTFREISGAKEQLQD